MKGIMDEKTFMPFHLVGTTKPVLYRLLLPAAQPILFHACAAGLNTPNGALYKGDLLQWGSQVGFTIGFAQSSSIGLYKFAAFVMPCERVSALYWRRQTVPLIEVVDVDAIVGSVPFAEVNGCLAPLLHSS